jgi:hypothetical protein
MKTRNFQILQKYRFAGRICLISAILLLQTFLSSCTSRPDDTAASGADGYFKSYVQDQVILNQSIDKIEITVAEQLTMALEISAPENFEIEFPAYSASLGDFTLIDIKTEPARMSGNENNVSIIHQAIYILEPYLPGTYSIPKITVKYRALKSDTEASELITEELQIGVRSLLDKDAANVEIKDITGPLSLPANKALNVLLVITFLLLIILGIFGFLYWRKVSGSKEAVKLHLPPDEIALQEIERLLAENLLGRGEVKLFHLRISDILRQYIENRFGIRAPERTTEEFLMELSAVGSQHNDLIGIHKSLLADFLILCDLVKFAKHEPTIAESEKTVSVCRKFIEETKGKKIEN